MEGGGTYSSGGGGHLASLQVLAELAAVSGGATARRVQDGGVSEEAEGNMWKTIYTVRTIATVLPLPSFISIPI